MRRKRYGIYFAAVTLLILAFFWISLILGSSDVTGGEVFKILSGDQSDQLHVNIILQIRLPRTLAAILLGGALSLAGYLLQTFFANPIVGPYVLGISSSAKLTVALAMIFFLSKGREIGLGMMVISALTMMGVPS